MPVPVMMPTSIMALPEPSWAVTARAPSSPSSERYGHLDHSPAIRGRVSFVHGQIDSHRSRCRPRVSPRRTTDRSVRAFGRWCWSRHLPRRWPAPGSLLADGLAGVNVTPTSDDKQPKGLGRQWPTFERPFELWAFLQSPGSSPFGTPGREALVLAQNQFSAQHARLNRASRPGRPCKASGRTLAFDSSERVNSWLSPRRDPRG